MCSLLPCFDGKNMYTFLLFRIKAVSRLVTCVYLYYIPLGVAACLSAHEANDLKVILSNFKTQNEAH